MNLFRKLDTSRWCFDFAVAKPGFYDAEIYKLGGRIMVYPEPSKIGLMRFSTALADIIRKAGPYRAVHSHVQFLNGAVMYAAAGASVPVRVAHSHTTSDAKGNGIRRRVYRLAMRRLIGRYATHKAACGADAAKFLFRNDGAPTVFLPNAIDLTPFAELPDDKDLLRRRTQLPLKRPLLGHIGRFVPVKNHGFLITLFIQVLQKLPSAMLVLVGDGPLRPAVQRQAREAGVENSVVYLGLRPDIPQLLGALDHLVLPSLWEGLPLTLIEAQAASLTATVSSSITSEVDLGLGLVQLLSLQQPTRRWVDAILDGLSGATVRVPWAVRSGALQGRGYDIDNLVRKLETLYEQGAS